MLPLQTPTLSPRVLVWRLHFPDSKQHETGKQPPLKQYPEPFLLILDWKYKPSRCGPRHPGASSVAAGLRPHGRIQPLFSGISGRIHTGQSSQLEFLICSVRCRQSVLSHLVKVGLPSGRLPGTPVDELGAPVPQPVLTCS